MERPVIFGAATPLNRHISNRAILSIITSPLMIFPTFARHGEIEGFGGRARGCMTQEAWRGRVHNPDSNPDWKVSRSPDQLSMARTKHSAPSRRNGRSELNKLHHAYRFTVGNTAAAFSIIRLKFVDTSAELFDGRTDWLADLIIETIIAHARCFSSAKRKSVNIRRDRNYPRRKFPRQVPGKTLPRRIPHVFHELTKYLYVTKQLPNYRLLSNDARWSTGSAEARNLSAPGSRAGFSLSRDGSRANAPRNLLPGCRTNCCTFRKLPHGASRSRSR